MDRGAWWAAVHGVAQSRTWLKRLSRLHALGKEMATQSSILAWRIPGTEEPGGLPSMGLHRVEHNWRSDVIPIPKKGNAKEYSNYRTIALISHASKVMLKFLQARLQQYMNCELLDFQTGFRIGRGTRDQIANTCWIIEKAKEFRKTSISALLTMPKPLTVWITINCGKFWKRWQYQTTWSASWEICMQVRKQ